MKKQGFIFSSAILLAVIFTFCKKTKIPDHPNEALETTSAMQAGLPEDYASVNGYLYACFATAGTNTLGIVTSFAAFGDPARNLAGTYDHYNNIYTPVTGTNTTQGNINAGNVRFSDINLRPTASSNLWNYMGYNNNNATMRNISNKWVSDGNGPFRALDQSVDRGFPRIKDTVFVSGRTQTLSIAKGYTLDLTGIASNYDSLTVMLTDFYGPSMNTHFVKKTFAADNNSAVFTKAELSSLFPNGLGSHLEFTAYNYSSQTIYGKRYLFELSRKSNMWDLQIKP